VTQRKSLSAPSAERMLPLLLLALAMGVPNRVAEAQQNRPLGITHRITTSNRVPTLPRQGQECRRSTPRVIGQFTSGVIGAWIGGVLSFAMIDDIDAPDRRVKGDAGYQRSANVAFAFGSWVGSTVGVTLASRAGCRFLGKAAIGTAIPSSVLLLGYDDPWLPAWGVVFGAPLQAIGGTIAIGSRK